MASSLQRTDCGRCGGSGQVTKAVAGRSGYVPCPSCDNVPRFAVPSDPPADSEARLAEIDERLDELEAQKAAAKELGSAVSEAASTLADAAAHDLVDDEQGTLLRHLARQVRQLDIGGHAMNIHYHQDSLVEEKQKVQLYLDHLREQRGENGD